MLVCVPMTVEAVVCESDAVVSGGRKPVVGSKAGGGRAKSVSHCMAQNLDLAIA